MIEVVLNIISHDGIRTIKVISDVPVTERQMLTYVPGAAREFAKVTSESTAALSLFYGTVVYPCREVVRFQVPSSKLKERHLVCWRLIDSEGYRVSEIIEVLAGWFFEQTKRRPQYAFVRSLPKNVERFTEVDGLMLLDVEWALEKCVMVGG